MVKNSSKPADKKGTETKIYNRVKACLAIKRIKAKVLAEHLEVSEQTVSKWSTNYSQPSIPQLYAIAEFLGVGLMDLLEPLGYKVSSAQLHGASALNEPES